MASRAANPAIQRYRSMRDQISVDHDKVEITVKRIGPSPPVRLKVPNSIKVSTGFPIRQGLVFQFIFFSISSVATGLICMTSETPFARIDLNHEFMITYNI